MEAQRTVLCVDRDVSTDITTYTYVYNGSQLREMTITQGSTVKVMEFTYDASGMPLAFTLDGTLYYYTTK